MLYLGNKINILGIEDNNIIFSLNEDTKQYTYKFSENDTVIQNIIMFLNNDHENIEFPITEMSDKFIQCIHNIIIDNKEEQRVYYQIQ